MESDRSIESANTINFFISQLLAPALSMNKIYFLIFANLLILCTCKVNALPEFAAQEDTNCLTCHFDPDGGGERNKIGKIYEDNGFTFPEDFSIEQTIEEELVDTKIQFSGNVRNAYIKTTEVKSEDSQQPGCVSCHSGFDSFILMKSELRVHAVISERTSLTIANNLGETLDAYGQLKLYKDQLHVKFGKFELPFAIQHKDHNHLLRSGNNIGSNTRDVGIAMTGYVDDFFFNAAVFNGNRQEFETNQHKGFMATIGGRFSNFRFGISHLVDKPEQVVETLTAPFITANFGRLSIEGEYDVRARSRLRTIDSSGVSVEFKYRWSPNFHLASRYESLNVNSDYTNSSSENRIVITSRYKATSEAQFEVFYWYHFGKPDQVIFMSSFYFGGKGG